MAISVNTTGKLRELLANMLLGIKSGDISASDAAVMFKGAAQITESFYAEMKYQQLQVKAGAKADELGSMPINS